MIYNNEVVASFAYWLILGLLFILNLYKKKSGEPYLWIAFYLFCIGSFISIFNLTSFAEFFMRISLIFWLFGLGLIFKQYKKL